MHCISPKQLAMHDDFIMHSLCFAFETFHCIFFVFVLLEWLSSVILSNRFTVNDFMILLIQRK